MAQCAIGQRFERESAKSARVFLFFATDVARALKKGPATPSQPILQLANSLPLSRPLHRQRAQRFANRRKSEPSFWLASVWPPRKSAWQPRAAPNCAI